MQHRCGGIFFLTNSVASVANARNGRPGVTTHIRARLVQLHEQLHEQLHNFNSQTANSLTNSLVSFSDNSLSQS
jgi:hypothetical protein